METIKKLCTAPGPARTHSSHLRSEEHFLDAYVRVSLRYSHLHSTFIKTIEIASVQVDEDKRRMGNFTRFLDETEKLASHFERAVFVECVHSPILQEILIRRGDYSLQPYSCDKSYWNYNTLPAASSKEMLLPPDDRVQTTETSTHVTTSTTKFRIDGSISGCVSIARKKQVEN